MLAAKFNRFFTVLFFSMICLQTESVLAQVIWDGGAGTLNWSDPDNWDPDGLPTASDEVTIGSSGNVVVQTGESFDVKSLTLTSSTLSINTGGQLTISVGGTYAFTLNNGTFNNNGSLSITNCTNGIRLMGTTSSLDNHSTISVSNHNGYGLLFSSGCTSCMVNNNGSFYLDNGTSSSTPTIFYQVSGNHFNNLGLLDIGATSNAGIGIGLGAAASGSLNNSGTINIHNTGAGRAGISVGFLGGSLINNSGATINFGAGIGGTWAGGFNMALTNNGTLNIHKAGTVSVVAMGTGIYGGSQPFDNSNNVSPASASIGCLQFNGDYTNSVGSPVPVTTIHLNGTTECSAHDKINVTGNATIGGTLTISLASGFTPIAGQSFTILQAGNRTGFYSTINYPTVSGIAWTTSYTSSSVIANAQAALPVELVDFKAILMDDRNILLKWQTASEWDNAGFQVERSTDGIKWESIGYVPGHGNSTEIEDYQFVDEPQKPIAHIYYRLRQLDIGGRSELSEVVTVNLVSNAYGSELAVWPNPTLDFFKINGDFSPDAQLVLYDCLGQVVMEGKATNDVHYDTRSLKNGVYILTIHDQQRSTSHRLMKQG
jgi:hypothetical protein